MSLFVLLLCSIPDSIGKDIEKKCQSIYPLHDVFIRKVKVLKKPKFDSESVISFSVVGAGRILVATLWGQISVQYCLQLFMGKGRV